MLNRHLFLPEERIFEVRPGLVRACITTCAVPDPWRRKRAHAEHALCNHDSVLRFISVVLPT